MTKILATIILLLTLLVSPLFAREKVMECSPDDFDYSIFGKQNPVYKLKKSLFFKDKVFVRKSGEWFPFCADSSQFLNYSIRGFVHEERVEILKIEQKEKWISCEYNELTSDGEWKSYNKLILDFELGKTILFYNGNPALRGKPLRVWADVDCKKVDF